MISLLPIVVLLAGAEPLTPGDHARAVTVGTVERSYLVHVPAKHDPARPVAIVLCYHGALTDARIQRIFTGLNAKSDAVGFVVVYPNGTGHGFALTWNSGGVPSLRPENERDDVAFTCALLDDLATVVNVDAKRVFACGMSNGGMMSHRLAIELPDRIAAIAAVGGTLALPEPKPVGKIPVMQIHGTKDAIVPWDGKHVLRGRMTLFRSVDETIDFWVKQNGAAASPVREQLPDRAPGDATTVERFTYAGGDDGADVVLVKVNGGGHTWPGHDPPVPLLGRATHDVDANDLIWEFFERHALR